MLLITILSVSVDHLSRQHSPVDSYQVTDDERHRAEIDGKDIAPVRVLSENFPACQVCGHEKKSTLLPSTPHEYTSPFHPPLPC